MDQQSALVSGEGLISHQDEHRFVSQTNTGVSLQPANQTRDQAAGTAPDGGDTATISGGFTAQSDLRGNILGEDMQDSH